MWLAVWRFLAGAKRWWNAEMAKALATVFVVLIVCITLAVFWGKAETAGGSKRDASWLQRFNSGMAVALQRRVEHERRMKEAVAKSLEQVEAERDEAVARAAAIAAELARLQGDPVVYPKELAREMNR